MAANGPSTRSPCSRAAWMSSSTGSSASIDRLGGALLHDRPVAVDATLVVDVLGLHSLEVGQPLRRQDGVRVQVGRRSSSDDVAVELGVTGGPGCTG